MCIRDRNKYAEKMRENAEKEQVKLEQEKAIKNKSEEFEKLAKNTEDLYDILDSLAIYLKELTSATGVYIGELEHPKKEIKEGDNETAHIDEAAPLVIRYIKATPDHQYLVDQSLKMTEGVTPEVFNVPEAAQAQSNEPVVDDANKEVKKEEGDAKKPVEDDEKGIVYRPQVTSEAKMKYFKVPRLGCYMAVPLIYSSCLFPESLDSAVAEYAVYMEKVKKNEEQIKAWEDQCTQLKAEREEQQQEISKTEEKVEGAPPGEEFKLPEKPSLEQPKEADYKTKPISYVVCMDTLGQDREFSKEQRKFVIDTCLLYTSPSPRDLSTSRMPSSA
eukprot:TRINITY_DN2997_c0_g1_i1.p1 TRINITY_DN2997_c0_g1~~TRINITY_DN2997_c0_g1_i1.p1  ORF type:complete len:331 (-),score=136.51 TRINITY_DN2997_c0_g1_i1:11-1003(-)